MQFAKPLSRLLRAAPTGSPAREDAVAALELGSPEQIAATALAEGEEALRAAAVRKLPDGEALRNLAGLSDGAVPALSQSLERIAQERVAHLIDSGAIDFTALRASVKNLAPLLCVAELCADPAQLTQLLASIDDPLELARLVVEGSSSRLRQLAAQRIEDPAALRQLLKEARGRDKNVYKIIKQKCDELHAEERRIAQVENEVTGLCASFERHSHRIYDAVYVATLEQFEARWHALEVQAAPDARDRARAAIDRCREIIAAHAEQLSQRAEQQSHEAARRAARDEAVTQAAQEAQRRTEALALAAAEEARLREAEETARAEKMAAEALAVRQIGGLIAKTNGALRDGNTRRAAGMRRALEEKLPTLPVVPGYLAAQVQQLDAKLNELKQWKDYAVAPKRAELIAEMEGLIGSSEEPQALADRIKQLQQDWTTITKGIVGDSDTDWQRFRQASHTAYQPCRDYFEAQAKQRQANLEKRKEVLERLQTFEAAHSGEHADWRAMAAVLREAPQEWRRHFPVDRAAGRAIQEEFDASLGRLNARLDAWYAENAADKKSLIQRAQQLLAKEDGREATEGVKRLQLQWKDVGPAQRDQERALWNEFREHCDAVYQRRQQAHAEYEAALRANKVKAVALCEEAESIAALSGPALFEGVGRMPQWRAAFEALGEVPRADERALHDRFERALKNCQARVAQQRAHAKEQAFIDLLEASRRIQLYAWAVGQGAEPTLRLTLKQAAEAFIGGVQQWPKGGAQALEEAWAGANAASDTEAPAHETALRMLCIRSEILANHPTPAEDQALRREYQVQRLVKHMGQGGKAVADDLDAMLLEWVRVGPVSTATYESLLARFRRCR